MKKPKKPASLHEALKKKWSIRIMLEKNYTAETAQWMTDRIESLVEYMQHGYALVAYHKQNGTFRLAKATLRPYQRHFNQKYDIHHIEGQIVYWDVEAQAWRNFLMENFLEWRPIN